MDGMLDHSQTPPIGMLEYRAQFSFPSDSVVAMFYFSALIRSSYFPMTMFYLDICLRAKWRQPQPLTYSCHNADRITMVFFEGFLIV